MNIWTRRAVISLFAVTFTGLLPALLAHAADRQDELRERFKARLPDIRQAKSAGKIGETTAGILEAVDDNAVKGDEKLKKLFGEENADRKELYKIIAGKEKTTEEKVAERNATRNFEKAKSGEFLKGKDGKWSKKQ